MPSSGSSSPGTVSGTVRNVVLVHGAYADGSSWSEVIERLQGAGLAATAVQNPLTSLADDVAHLVQTIGIESAHIVGASFGGFVAQEFALKYPAMTRKLVLCCTSFGGPNHVAPDRETLIALASTKGLNSEERMRANLLLAFTPEYIRTQTAEVDRVVHLRATNEVPEHVYMSQLQAAVSFNAEARVERITSPTLVLSGDADVIVPLQNSRNLAAKVPGAQLRIIQGGSHTFFIEQAEKFNDIVSEFLG